MRGRIRFRIRWLIAAVAIAALASWGWRLASLVGTYRARAGHFANLARDFDRAAGLHAPPGARSPADRDGAAARAKFARAAERCRGLAGKYQRAQARPWLSVAPDPPSASLLE